MHVSAVLFDVEGTLIHRGGGSPVERDIEGLRRAYEVLAGGGLPLPDFRTTFAMVYDRLVRSSAGLVYGNFREVSIPSMVAAFFENAFPDMDDSLVEKALDAWYESLGEGVRPAEGAREALEALKRAGVPAGASGNTRWGGKYLRRDLERAGLGELVDVVVGSADVGYRKPNLFLLREALRQLGVEGRGAVHVGDDPREDLEAPQELDMAAFLVAPPGSNPRADRTLASLFELEGLLETWQN
jgi:FMN phosphatase YigB (HAD superfamily)